MYLIDSSLWIDYFRPRGSSIIKRRLREVLQKDEALTCGIILVEVLRGARNDEQYSILQESLFSLPEIAFDQQIFERAAHWGFQLDRKGKIASTTDLLIAAAAYQKARLLHNDKDFELIASEFALEQERLS